MPILCSELCSEDHILRLVDEIFPRATDVFSVGRGDDCAVWQPGGPVCVSTDLFLEDVHFRRRYFSAEDIGWKALAVNLSDLAAMGARPVGFSVGLALPPDADEALVRGLLQGMAGVLGTLPAADGPVCLSGGDISRGDKLHVCVTVFGEMDGEAPLIRRHCQPGDMVFAVGRLGLARLGLIVLEGECGSSQVAERGSSQVAAAKVCPTACTALLRPVPRIREGLRLRALRQRADARMSLMDVSDGLARDLPRLLGLSGLARQAGTFSIGAELTLPAPHEDWRCHAKAHGWSHERVDAEMMAGGDDYALLGTCEPKLAAQLMVTLPEITPLGEVTDTGTLRCNGQNLGELAKGFDHFQKG